MAGSKDSGVLARKQVEEGLVGSKGCMAEALGPGSYLKTT